MNSQPLSPKRPSNKIIWLAVFLLVAAGVSFLTLRVKTDDKVSLQNIPMKETKVLARAIDFIEKNYVDPQAVNAGKMLSEAARELVRSIPPLLVKEKPHEMIVTLGEKKLALPTSNPVSLDEVPVLLSRLLGFLDLFYDGKLDERERLTLAMTGAVDTLDSHSNYLSPKVFNEFKIGTKGNFGGLGIVIGIRDGDLSVIAPLEGTPADRAGIKAKDKIVQIGGESTINMGLTEAVEKLRGPVGSRVSLVIAREGVSDPLKFTLTRALIHIQSVGGRLLEDKRFGMVKIKNFQEDTMEQFLKTLREFESGGNRIEGLILDLRNNPGGLLDQAVELSDFFLSRGIIVKTVGARGEALEIEKAGPGDGGEEIPLVVIVNENSASASEIVAGALQFNDRAVVIGNRSFGKGSVQTVYDLKDGSALKLTIAKYLTAQDYAVQSKGINPDVGLIPATVPAKLTDDKGKLSRRVDLFEDVKRRELDLEEMKNGDEEEEHKEPNLPSPPVQMTYLGPDKDRDADDDDENAGKIDLSGDFPVTMAARLLALSHSLGQYMPGPKAILRPNLVAALPPVLEELRKEEEEKIREALQILGVDWSSGGKEGKPSAQVTVELLDEEDRPRNGLSAGESGFLRVTVENRGNAPFYRLAAVTKSEDPLFANLEFPLGKVSPGQSRSWKTPLKIPDFVHRRKIPVELEFHDQYEGDKSRLPSAPALSLQVEEPEAPLFEYSYRVIDNGSQGSRGNGNAKVEKGETVALALTIKNFGRGESKSPVVNLKKVEGEETFIEKGREELKPIPPGGQADVVLKFRVPESLTGKLSFDLHIHDTHLGEDLTDRLDFGAESTPPPQNALQAPPILDIPWSALPLSSSGGSYALKGSASDDTEIRHLFIFVGNNKVFYQAPASGPSKKLDFETTLPLKKGANLITLAAQDDRELTSRKQWIVWREK